MARGTEKQKWSATGIPPKLVGIRFKVFDVGIGPEKMHVKQFPSDSDAAGLGPHFEN